MSEIFPVIDPDGLLEYSVVYSDRSLNHMSKAFQGVMNDISSTLKNVYSAAAVVVVPGSGTFGMEAVARQFATGKKCLVIRNGFFSYRWTQIFDMGDIPASVTVLKARTNEEAPEAPFIPAPIDTVVATIKAENPDFVFAPHVETSSGMMLPDDYIHAIAEAIHSVGGIFVLDCIASGTIWVNMKTSGVDVLISAPQKGWSASPCCGLVMLSPLALRKMESTTNTSFAWDLGKWLQIMRAYENGDYAYHATMPTDSLTRFRETLQEIKEYGFEKASVDQRELGDRVRDMLTSKGMQSIAAEGYGAPSVVVAYTSDPDIKSGKKFADVGIQIAAGVPLMCNEPEDFRTFRLGLFGLDKLQNIDRTVASLEDALENVLS